MPPTWGTEGFDVNKFIQNQQQKKQGATLPPRQRVMENQFGQPPVPMAPSTFQQPQPEVVPIQNAPLPSQQAQQSSIFPFSEGSVFLIWKDFSPTAQQVTTEANVFPIKGETYLVGHKDYYNEEEKVQAVKEFNTLIARYSNVVNKTGQYILIVGSVVNGIETREVITY